jgi:hypothetical protein
MARIKALEREQFPLKAGGTLHEIEQAFGRIPNLFKDEIMKKEFIT